MQYAAIDLHTAQSQIRIVGEDGQVIEDRRVPTTRERLAAVFAQRDRLRVLVEASTESEWVAEHLEALGHEVIVADPNYVLMYARRSRRIKTDKRDVAALAEACRLGIYRPTHRRSREHRRLRRQLRVRDHLIRVRTKTINFLRAQLRAEGVRLRPGEAETISLRTNQADLPAELRADVEPLLAFLTNVTNIIKSTEAPLIRRSHATPIAQRLMTTPGVGPMTALTFIAVVDTPERFPASKSLSSYLGLVPLEHSSGECQRKGRISRSGDSQLRGLLVQAAWVVMRSRHPAATPLRLWMEQVASRRGRGVAIVGLARRLGRILFALWRDQTVFDAAYVIKAA